MIVQPKKSCKNQTGGETKANYPQNSSTLSKLITRLMSSIHPCAAAALGV